MNTRKPVPMAWAGRQSRTESAPMPPETPALASCVGADSVREDFRSAVKPQRNQRYSRALTSFMKSRWSWRLFSQ